MNGVWARWRLRLLQERQITARRLVAVGQAVIAAAVILVFSSGIMRLSENFSDEINSIASSSSDSTQWALSQIEVELLRLDRAVSEAGAYDQPDLAEARFAFDVFYSRIKTVLEGRQYGPIRNLATVNELLQRIWDATLEMSALMDVSDETMTGNLNRILALIHATEEDVRKLSLSGVSVFANVADIHRGEISDTLSSAAKLLIVVLSALALTVLALMRSGINMFHRVRIEKMIRHRLEEIARTSLDAIIVLNKDGNIIEYNGAAEKIFGHSEAIAVGKPMVDLIFPSQVRRIIRRELARSLRSENSDMFGKGIVNLNACRESGEVFPIEMVISTADSEDGRILISYIRDISVRLSQEAELIEARDKAVAGEKAKAMLLAVMSHEMRTPLNGILGTLDLMKESNLSRRQLKYLSVIRNSGNLLLSHVNDVLDIAGLDSGKRQINFEKMDVNAFIHRLVEGQQGVAKARNNRLDIATPDETLSSVLSDPRALGQILLNLLGNAQKFTENGTIRVMAARDAETGLVEIRVTDTGIGIAPELHEEIFENFVTADASYSRSAEGTGLGLGIARRLTESLGGKIGVESLPGVGSSFWIRLRMDEFDTTALCPPDQTRESRASPPQAKALRILLVEDNEINRLVANRLLVKAGHSVREATDGIAGKRIASREPFDLILMDIAMPDMDGVSAALAIRSVPGPNQSVPIVALTAHALAEDRERFAKAGISDTLVKPITLETLSIAVNRSQGLRARQGSSESGPLIDLGQVLDMRSSLGGADYDARMTAFCDEVDQVLAMIAGDDWLGAGLDSVLHNVHKLAGSAAVFGAARLRGQLGQLEIALLGRDYSGAKDIAKSAPGIWAATKVSLSSAVAADQAITSG